MVRILTLVFLFIPFICSELSAQKGAITVPRKPDTLLLEEYNKIKNVPHDIFEAGYFTGKNNIRIKYRYFKPIPKKDPRKKYPLVVVFHGSGSIGKDNESQLGLLPKLFASEAIQKKYRSYVLAPQFETRSSDYIMDSTQHVLTSVPRPCVNTVLQLIDSLQGHPNVDPMRIYAVGFSMGGSTAINALVKRPELFAAGISIAGIPQFKGREKIKKIPLWLIHGIDDPENPINSVEKFFEEMKPGSRIRFWKLEGIRHTDVFTMELLGETLPKWLFRRHKPY